ncbi:hypothetical protein NW765_001374 [Fusarium oxysporum]|nr:hypothetical protein NW765_001374 [Fusarium oxysporum]KAJ4264168.1 hypothetical protein NW764_015932 [Fusarium oxysporum]
MLWRTDNWSASFALEANGSPVDEAGSLWSVLCGDATCCCGTDMPDIGIHNTTPAVIGWQRNNALHFLTEPDPNYNNITLTTRFDTTCSFFELSVPIKIKGIRLKDDKAGDNSISALLLRICPSTVKSLSLTSIATAPEAIRKKFTSAILRLDLGLGRNLDVVVPSNAEEPIVPGRAASGVVLDAIRQFSNTTSLSIYVQDSELFNTQLQSISNAFSQGLYKSSRSAQHDLVSLYGGRGAKMIHLSAETGQLPPPYTESTSPPPSASTYQQKRPRRDSHDDCDNAMSQIWVVLAKMKERDARMEALENENRRLKQGMGELQERLALLETQKDDERRVESQTAENAAELVNIDLELMEIRQDVDELKMKADAVERGELVDTVKNDVLEYMRIRLWGDG